MSLSVCKEAGNSRDDGGNEMVMQKSYQNQGKDARNNVKINTHTHKPIHQIYVHFGNGLELC